MKSIIIYIYLLLFLSSCSTNSVSKKPPKVTKLLTSKEIKNSQLAWGKEITKRIHKRWFINKSKETKPKNQVAFAKFTISKKGLIVGPIQLSCKVSPSYCSSVSSALTRSQPFPLPPQYLTKTNRTFKIKFD